MMGAESIIAGLEAAGVEVCFANPGTTEMHLVIAMDRAQRMRPVLVLFEGVASAAADGYARMLGKPAACVFHLGPGFANAMANIHNARRAGSPMVNLVGDHATAHRECDAPLASDIEAIVASVSHWTRYCGDPGALGTDLQQAIAAAGQGSGRIASLIVPADLAWGAAQGQAGAEVAMPAPPSPDASALESALSALRSGEDCALLLGGGALRGEALETAGRIAAATGARLITDTFPARLERGAGRVPVARIPYLVEMAVEFLSPLKHLVIVGNKPPVGFFAYPGKPSWLAPAGCVLHRVAGPDSDLGAVLGHMAEALGATGEPPRTPAQVPPVPEGPLTAEAVAAVVAALMPEDAIVSDESATSGLPLFPMTAGAARHDWLCLTGGAIGQSLPLAVGAAIACPQRKVLCLTGDGGAMYTLQALWTMAREKLDVVTVVYANRSYAILNLEFLRTGAGMPGNKAHSLMSLGQPELDWVSLAKGMGVPASRQDTVAGFRLALEQALANGGPVLIEAVVPPLSLG